MEEIWKDIKDYEGQYQVSNFGNVKSLNYFVINTKGFRHFHEGKLMHPYREKYGYMIVCLTKNRKHKNVKVHRLVAEAFIPNPENKPQVNHIDGDKTNNKVENLEWCNNAENITHAYKSGLTYYTKGRQDNFEKIKIDNSVKVIQMDLDGNEIKIWNSMEEAGKHVGVVRSNISECCSGKHRTAGGYRWKYAEK